MKFHLNHDHANKTLAIPRAALQLSGLVETSDLTIHTENGCVLLLPEKLSVAQTLKTFQLLTADFPYPTYQKTRSPPPARWTY